MDMVAELEYADNARHFVRPFGRRWLVVENGVRIVGEYLERGQAERLAAYLNGGLPDDDAPGWERVYAAAVGAEGGAA